MSKVLEQLLRKNELSTLKINFTKKYETKLFLPHFIDGLQISLLILRDIKQTSGFLMFSGSKEKDQWHYMDKLGILQNFLEPPWTVAVVF